MNIFSNSQWFSLLMMLILGVGLIVSESWLRRIETVETNSKLVQISSDVLIHEIFGFYQQDRYAKMIPLAQRLLKTIKVQVGEQCSNMAESLNNLVEFYQLLGRYSTENSLYQHSLSIRETQLAQKHSDSSKSFNDQALFYLDQSFDADSKTLCQCSLSIRKEQLGP